MAIWNGLSVARMPYQTLMYGCGWYDGKHLWIPAILTPSLFVYSLSLSPLQSRPKLRVVEPIDYESELSSRRKDLGREKYLGLMLFPQHDVEVRNSSRLLNPSSHTL